MLTLKSISKTYHDNEILQNINLQFRDKELVCILGPSGCGKTTLLNIIATVEKATCGEIYINGSKISLLNESELGSFRGHYISYIFQHYNLINHINIINNINLNSEIKNIPNNKGTTKRIIDDLKLNKIEKQYPLKISGGEKQRVAIARALVNNTPIILADEPTGALDSINGETVMQIFQKIAKEKLVIIVTHNESLAKKYATRIIKMKDGKIEKDSHPFKENVVENFKAINTRLKYLTAFKLSFNNLKNKKIRSYLIVLAFSIGLISLALVLSISKGFKKEITTFEKEGLYNYPLIINKEYYDVENSFQKNNIVSNNNEFNIKRSNIKYNNIDYNLLKTIQNIDLNLLDGIAYYKEVPISFQNVSYVNPNNDYFILLNGKYPTNKNEILLLIDQEAAIDEQVAKYLNIKNQKYDSIINYHFKVQNQNLKIVGIVKAKDNYFYELNGLLYDDNLFDTEINSIHFYANSYKNKIAIKEYFKDYNILDEANTILELTGTLVGGITIILISFSIISLIVSVIMIAIISYISVLERQKEIGILKTMGASKNDIIRVFLAENIIIGIMSSIIAIDISFYISKIINIYINNLIGIKSIVDFDYTIIMFIILLSITLTCLAGIVPSKYASKKRIADILYSE